MSRIPWREIKWHYINLAHRQDRREHIARELAKTGIMAERFEALTKEDYHGPKSDVAVMAGTPKTIGNWLSHTALWKTVQDSDRIVGVLEDDALLCEDFTARLQYIEDHFDKDWDIFYLGATYHVNPPVWHKNTLGRDFELTDVKYIHRVYGAFSNQGYLVNGRSVTKLLEMMQQEMPTARGSDHALIQLQPKLQCFSFTPGMVFQIDSQSDIGEGMTMFSHFLTALGPYVWANRLEEFDYDNFPWCEGALK